MPIYAWVIEHPEGVIVIDTGETARTSEPGYFPGWQPYFRNIRMAVPPEQEIGPQLRARGIPPEEVRWVIMTHLHTDHAGGIGHFPKSEILIERHAYAAAQGFAGKLNGFLPQHYPTWLAPRLIALDAAPYKNFPGSVTLTKAGDVVLVPTPGHTATHLSVILRDGEGAYFFAGIPPIRSRICSTALLMACRRMRMWRAKRTLIFRRSHQNTNRLFAQPRPRSRSAP